MAVESEWRSRTGNWLFLTAYHCVSVFAAMFYTNVIMSVYNCGHTVYTVNVTIFSVFPAVTYRWQIWKHIMDLNMTLQFGHRLVSITRLNLICFHRLRLYWSTFLAGSSTVASSLMASLRPVASWSWRCRWWSGLKVGNLHFTHTCLHTQILTLLAFSPSWHCHWHNAYYESSRSESWNIDICLACI